MKCFSKAILLMLFATISIQAQYKHASDIIQAGEILNWSLVSNGGTSSMTSGYSLEGSLAQPVTGISSCQLYIAGHGYWYSGLENKLSVPEVPSSKDFVIVQPSITNNGNITVRSSLAGYARLEIYNYLGVRVYNETIEGQDRINTNIDLNLLKIADGAYFIAITNEKRCLTCSFILNF